MSRLQKLLVLLCSVVLVTVLGCSAWMEGLSPAHIDPAAIEYSKTEPTVYTPYTSLWDARRIQRELEYQHLVNQRDLARLLEDDKGYYNKLTRAMQINIASAEELRDTLFSPTGPMSLLFAAVPALGLGAYLIPRKKDTEKIKELENKLNGGQA